MATAPKIALPIHQVENVLAFDEEKIIKAGEIVTSKPFPTHQFDKIRVVAVNEKSTCDVHVRLTILEPEGKGIQEPIAALDEFTLKPHNQLTRVYDVPATQLQVSMVGLGKPDTKAEVEVLIYGQY